MANINWPSGAIPGQTYQSPDGEIWTWNGYAWDGAGSNQPGPTGPAGPIGPTGVGGTGGVAPKVLGTPVYLRIIGKAVSAPIGYTSGWPYGGINKLDATTSYSTYLPYRISYYADSEEVSGLNLSGIKLSDLTNLSPTPPQIDSGDVIQFDLMQYPGSTGITAGVSIYTYTHTFTSDFTYGDSIPLPGTIQKTGGKRYGWLITQVSYADEGHQDNLQLIITGSVTVQGTVGPTGASGGDGIYGGSGSLITDTLVTGGSNSLTFGDKNIDDDLTQVIFDLIGSGAYEGSFTVNVEHGPSSTEPSGINLNSNAQINIVSSTQINLDGDSVYLSGGLAEATFGPTSAEITFYDDFGDRARIFGTNAYSGASDLEITSENGLVHISTDSGVQITNLLDVIGGNVRMHADDGVSPYYGTLSVDASITANRGYSLPDATGTIALTNDIMYLSDGTLSGDRTIETDGNGLVLKGSSEGAYFDFHSFKGSGGYSIGTTFNSLTVDWAGGGTNSAFGTLYATQGIDIKVGAINTPGLQSDNMMVSFTNGDVLIRPAGPTQYSSMGDPAFSNLRIQVDTGATIGIDDTTEYYLQANGAEASFNRPNNGPIAGGGKYNFYEKGNVLQWNQTGASGGYTAGNGPNTNGTHEEFLYSEIASGATGTAKRLKNDGTTGGGIDFYVSNSVDFVKYGQIEATVNYINTNNDMACWVVRASFKTFNNTATLGTTDITTLYDETSGGANLTLSFGTVSAFASTLQFNCDNAPLFNSRWDVNVKVHGAGNYLSVI